MRLTASQIAQMNELLDEALPLDPEARRRWLDGLSSEYQALAPALRAALLPVGADNALAGLLEVGAGIYLEGIGSGPRPLELVGPYRLIRPLGEGGMAEVWLAQRADGAFKREVALKLPMLASPRQDLASRFARERDILAALEHPHIARLYDAGVDSNAQPYLAMEYVAGQPLTAWCDAHHLGIRERLALFAQVLDAVQYAHDHQVIHRDIKPSNILVTDSGQVRLLDFGVAKLLIKEEKEQTDLTQLYGRALTPGYASPELTRDEQIGAATDVYSLGVVLYELLSGSSPYHLKASSSLTLLEHAISTAEVKRPSTQLAPSAGGKRGTTQRKLARRLKGDLDAIVLKALAKAPPDRYDSAAALADDLQRSLRGEPVEARPDWLSYRAGKFVLRHRTGLAASAAATALLAAALGYALRRSPGAVPAVATNTTSSDSDMTVVVEDKSIAVLPFLDMSENKDQEYFSDGLSEELIDHLVHSADLRVIARTSSFQFKGKNEDVRSIARKLGVTNVLEGSVRKAGQQLRITAQLIRASDGAHLWSQTYDRNLVDIFKVQDEIAEKVSEALHVALRNGHPPGNRELDVRAYNLVLEGNYFKARKTLSDVRKATQFYRQAIEINPDDALAWARLASAYLNEKILKGPAPEDQNRPILDALDQAIRLDPNLVWAYYTRGGFEMNVTWNWTAAQADAERIREIDPRFELLASAFGDIALAFGEIDRAVELYQDDLERNPLDPITLDSLGIALCAANRLQQCLETRLRLQQLHPEFGGINSSVGIAHLYLGQLAAALEAIQSEPNEDYRLGGLAMVYSAMGRHTESDAALNSLTDNFASSDAYGIAEVHAYRGEIDDALRWLDRAYQQHNAAMLGLKVDPLLRNLHSDTRFQALLTRMRLNGPRNAQVSRLQISHRFCRFNFI